MAPFVVYGIISAVSTAVSVVTTLTRTRELRRETDEQFEIVGEALGKQSRVIADQGQVIADQGKAIGELIEDYKRTGQLMAETTELLRAHLPALQQQEPPTTRRGGRKVIPQSTEAPAPELESAAA